MLQSPPLWRAFLWVEEADLVAGQAPIEPEGRLQLQAGARLDPLARSLEQSYRDQAGTDAKRGQA